MAGRAVSSFSLRVGSAASCHYGCVMLAVKRERTFARLCHFLVAALTLPDCSVFNLQVRCLFSASAFAVRMPAGSAAGRNGRWAARGWVGPEAVHSRLNCLCSTA